ncbi:MAG: YgeY family selenium metabolism-linked hydrolase [Synergistaceae bacterium]|nr:YgeY family selenium metabolism-linked hydrolase [Synergistota bacterium]NLM70957.1 YgeY family selenium metabolism-linked hydrolase [Synergistaceae bacterium]
MAETSRRLSQTALSAGPDDLVQLCRELIRRPGISGREGEVARFTVESMRSLGFDSVTVDSYGNVVGEIVFGGDGPRLLLTAQMDHVDAGDAAEWTKYPFGAFIEDGRIYGRAASDQKGALAAMMTAASALKRESGDDLRGSLFVAGAVHQETFEREASRAIADLVEPDCVIVGEASDLALERGQRGRVEIRIDVIGRMAHSSHPEHGVNAGDVMVRFLTFLKARFRPPKDDFLGEGILVLTSLSSSPCISSGDDGCEPRPDGGAIPERCTALFDRRLLSGETLEGVARQFDEIVAEASRAIPELRAEVSLPVMEDRCYTGAPIRGSRFAPAWTMPAGSPFLQSLSRALDDAGLRSEISSRPGFGTNGCHYAAERNIPTVIYGPSRRELVHTVDEYIDIDALLGSCAGYGAMARMLLTPASSWARGRFSSEGEGS